MNRIDLKNEILVFLAHAPLYLDRIELKDLYKKLRLWASEIELSSLIAEMQESGHVEHTEEEGYQLTKAGRELNSAAGYTQ